MRKYAWRTRPYHHQVLGVKFAMKQFRKGLGVALLFEPRTGKTKTTIDTLAVLNINDGVRKVLIIAPNRVLGTWVQEIHTHCPLTTQTIIWDARARRRPIPPFTGPYDLQILIVNFEAFGVPGKRLRSGRRSHASGRTKTRAMIRAWLGGEPAACVVDEGHRIKNPSGKVSNMIVSMRKDFAYRFLLTGTPITKAHRAHDIYMLWQWVNPRRFDSWGPTVEAFKNHIGQWVALQGFKKWKKPIESGMEDLRRGLHQDAMVVLREECFDLPPRQDRVIPVTLTTSRRHYVEMAEEMVTQLQNGAIAEASIPLVVTLRLLQIASGFVGIPERRGKKMVSVPHPVGTEKLAALKLLLEEEIIELERPVVIAARFKFDLNRIERLCKALKLPTYSIRGGMTRGESDASLRAFQRSPDRACAMVIQPAAAGEGIDLSTADQMIWYSLTSSWVNWTQACDRIALSKRSTMFTYLQADDTVDGLVFDSLQTDTDVSRQILQRPDKLLPHELRKQ